MLHLDLQSAAQSQLPFRFTFFVSPKGERGFFVSFLADAAETNEQPPNLTYPPEIGCHIEGQCSIDRIVETTIETWGEGNF